MDKLLVTSRLFVALVLGAVLAGCEALPIVELDFCRKQNDRLRDGLLYCRNVVAACKVETGECASFDECEGGWVGTEEEGGFFGSEEEGGFFGTEEEPGFGGPDDDPVEACRTGRSALVSKLDECVERYNECKEDL